MLKPPRQTKASLQRQKLALTKKIEQLSMVPDELLLCVFKYLSMSDLLRCCCVSKTWKEVADIQSLWEMKFKCLPKPARDLSEKAKTTGYVNWKKECINCSKERRRRWIKKLCKDTNKGTCLQKKRRTPFVKSLHIRWLLVFKDTSSQHHQVTTSEDFVFNVGMTVRWNELDLLHLSKMVSLKVYALTPLLYDKELQSFNDSVYTRSLVMMHSFKDTPFSRFMKVGEDDQVSVYAMKEYLYFGIWKSSTTGEVAFIGLCSPTLGLPEVTQLGNSERKFDRPKHQVIMDDVDTKYGLVSGYGYFAEIELRSSRKSYFYEHYKEFNTGVWIDDNLCITHRRYTDYVFYDFKDKIAFTWKTLALKGAIKDLLILDVNLYDCNQQAIWSFSSPVKLEKCKFEKDNYSYENGEIWVVEKNDEKHGKCIIDLMKNTETNEATILTVKFELRRSFLNEWFGTAY